MSGGGAAAMHSSTAGGIHAMEATARATAREAPRCRGERQTSTSLPHHDHVSSLPRVIARHTDIQTDSFN